MFIIFIIVISVLILVQWLHMKPFYWKDRNIKYSVPIPIFGSSLGQMFKSFNKYWYDKYNQFSKNGGTWGCHVFNRRVLMPTDPLMLQEILIQKYDMFNSRGMHNNPKHDPFAKNLFHSSGEEWRKIRAKTSPFFTPLKLKSLSKIMKTNITDYVNQFDSASDTDQPIDVNVLSLKLSTDIIVNTIFGTKPDSFVNPDSFFFSIQKKLFGHNFVLRILLGTISPFLYNLFRVTIIPSSVTEKLKEFVEEVMNLRAKGIGVRDDFIQGMLDLVEKDKNEFSRADATAQCMVMYLGGTETIGNTLSFLLNELAYHQEIQDRVRDEIKLVLSKNDNAITYENINQLVYTNMVINETVRKYPIVPVVTRMCTKSTKLSSGIDLEEGDGVYISIMGFHMDPKYYPNPEEFIPERFADDAFKNECNAYMPFGVGPRMCIGWKMALIEMALTISELIPKFKILPSHKSKRKITFNYKPTLNPVDGIWLNIERI